MKRLLIVTAAVMAIATTLGCGAKSRPIPPELTHPESINDLSAKPDPMGIRLTWSRPMKYTRGKSLKDLAGFRLMRSEGEESYAELAELPITDQERFQKVHRFAYVDTTAQMGHSYRYMMIAETSDGYQSDPSNVARQIRTQPTAPLSPENFKLPMPAPLRGIPTPTPAP
ncbi:MAG TPA: hypothetical protein VFE43_07480 [Candidatus Binataceae bacterium]|jgi:hypothetical protein|nr:hypothetical protein [Candidatus Binataceae bacterium]